MKIEIKTLKPPPLLDPGYHSPIDGISIYIPPQVFTRDLSEAWQIAIFSASLLVPAAVIAAVIVKYFGTDKRTTKITINRTEVEYSEGDIVRFIEETQKAEYE